MLAHAHGAEVHALENVLGWEPKADGVVVTTPSAQATQRIG